MFYAWLANREFKGILTQHYKFGTSVTRWLDYFSIFAIYNNANLPYFTFHKKLPEQNQNFVFQN